MGCVRQAIIPSRLFYNWLILWTFGIETTTEFFQTIIQRHQLNNLFEDTNTNVIVTSSMYILNYTNLTFSPNQFIQLHLLLNIQYNDKSTFTLDQLKGLRSVENECGKEAWESLSISVLHVSDSWAVISSWSAFLCVIQHTESRSPVRGSLDSHSPPQLQQSRGPSRYPPSCVLWEWPSPYGAREPGRLRALADPGVCRGSLRETLTACSRDLVPLCPGEGQGPSSYPLEPFWMPRQYTRPTEWLRGGREALSPEDPSLIVPHNPSPIRLGEVPKPVATKAVDGSERTPTNTLPSVC